MQKGLEVTKTHKCRSVPSLHLADFSLTHCAEPNVGYYPCNYKHGLEGRTLGGKYHPGLKLAEPCLYDENNLTDSSSSEIHCQSPSKQSDCYVEGQYPSENNSCHSVYPEKSQSQPSCKHPYSVEMEGFYKVDWSAAGEEYTDADSSSELKDDCEENFLHFEADKSLHNSWNNNMDGDSNQIINYNYSINRRKDNDEEITKDPIICDNECCKKVSSSSQNCMVDQSDVFSQIELLENETFPKIGSTDISYIETEDLGFCSSRKSSESSLFSQKSDESTTNVKSICLDKDELEDNEAQSIVTVQRKNSFTDLAQNSLLQMLSKEHQLQQPKTLVEEMFDIPDKCDNQLDAKEESVKEATASYKNVKSSQNSLKVDIKTQDHKFDDCYLSDVPDSDCAKGSLKNLANNLPFEMVTKSITEEPSTKLKPSNSIFNSVSSDDDVKKLKNLKNISEFCSKDTLESLDKLSQTEPSLSQSSSCSSSKQRPRSAGTALKNISAVAEQTGSYCFRPHSAGENQVLGWNAASESPSHHSKSISKASNQELRSDECFSFNSIVSPSLTSERMDADSPSWSTDSVNKYRDFAKMPKRELLARLVAEHRHREELDQLLAQLHDSYDKMLAKYAEAENTIDQLRLGNHFRLEASPQLPVQEIQQHLAIPEKDQLKAVKPLPPTSGTQDGCCQTDLSTGDSGCLMSSIACLLLRANCLLEQVDSLRECVEEGISMDPEVEIQVFNYLWDSLISLQQEVHSYTNVGSALENLTLEDTKKLLIKINTLLQTLQPKQKSLEASQSLSIAAPPKTEEEKSNNAKAISSTESTQLQQTNAVCPCTTEAQPPQHTLSEVDSGCHSASKSIPSNLGKLSSDDMLAFLCQKSTYLSISDVEQIAKHQTSVASINLNASKEQLERQSSSESECLNVVKALLKVIYKEDGSSQQTPWSNSDHTRSYKSDTTLTKSCKGSPVDKDKTNLTNTVNNSKVLNGSNDKAETFLGNKSQETQNLEYLKFENTQIKFSHSAIINKNEDFHKVEDNLIVEKFQSSNVKSYCLAGGNDVRIEKCNKSEENVISTQIKQNKDLNLEKVDDRILNCNKNNDSEYTFPSLSVSEIDNYDEVVKKQEADRQFNEMCALLKNKVEESMTESDDAGSRSKESVVMKLLDEVKRRLSEKTTELDSKGNNESEEAHYRAVSPLEQKENDDSHNAFLNTFRTDATDDIQSKQELLSPDICELIKPVVQFRGNRLHEDILPVTTSSEHTTEVSSENVTELDFIYFPAAHSIPISNLIERPSTVSAEYTFMNEESEFNQEKNVPDRLILQKLNDQIQQLREALFLKNSQSKDTSKLCSQSCQTDLERDSSTNHRLHVCNNCGSSFNNTDNYKTECNHWQNVYKDDLNDNSCQSQKNTHLRASRSGTVLHCCGLHHILYSEKPESDLFHHKAKNAEYEGSSYKATCPCCQYILEGENNRPRTAPSETLLYKENEEWNCSENSPQENLQSDFHLSESDLFKSINCHHHGKPLKFCQFCENLSSSSISEDAHSFQCYETDQYSPVSKINDLSLQQIPERENSKLTIKSDDSDNKANAVDGLYGVKFTLNAKDSDSIKISENAEYNTKTPIISCKTDDDNPSSNLFLSLPCIDISEMTAELAPWPPLSNRNEEETSFRMNEIEISLDGWNATPTTTDLKAKAYSPVISPQLSEDRSWNSHKHLKRKEKKQFPKNYTCRENHDSDIDEMSSDKIITQNDNQALLHSKISSPIKPTDDMQVVNCPSPVPISAVQILSEKLPLSHDSVYLEKDSHLISEGFIDGAANSHCSLATLDQNESNPSDNLRIAHGWFEYPKELDESLGTIATCNSDQLSDDNISHNSQSFVRYMQDVTDDKEFRLSKKCSESLNNLMIIDSAPSRSPSVSSDNSHSSELQLTFQSVETKSVGIQSEVIQKDADTQAEAEAYPVTYKQENQQMYSSIGIQSDMLSKDAFTQLCPNVTDAVTEMSPASQTDTDLTSVSIAVQLNLNHEISATPRSETESTYTEEMVPIILKTDESSSISLSDKSDEEKSTDHMEETETAPLSMDLLPSTKPKHFHNYKGKWKSGDGGGISNPESTDHHSCKSCARLLKKTEAVATSLLLGLQNSQAVEESSEEDLEVRKLQLIHALDLANKMAKRLKKHSMKMLHSLSSESDLHE